MPRSAVNYRVFKDAKQIPYAPQPVKVQRASRPIQMPRQSDYPADAAPLAAADCQEETPYYEEEEHFSSYEGRRPPRVEYYAVATERLPVPASTAFRRTWIDHKSIAPLFKQLGIGFILLIAIFYLIILPAFHWASNHWNYGVDHLAQITAVVGHQDSATHPSVFVTMHLAENNQVEIVEFPGGDLHHAISYPLNIASSDPVTLTFQEDAQHPDKPNMVAQVGDNTVVLFNTGKAFSPTGK